MPPCAFSALLVDSEREKERESEPAREREREGERERGRERESKIALPPFGGIRMERLGLSLLWVPVQLLERLRVPSDPASEQGATSAESATP